ncbi:MAG: hypothetical protein AB7P37_07040 [Ramlibacter sp.]
MTPDPRRPVRAGSAPPPRLVCGLVEGKASAPVLRDPYNEVWIETFPSLEHSPELIDPDCHDCKGIVMVEQSTGAASAASTLVTRNLTLCSVALVVNTGTGKAYMAHLDSGSRARWPSGDDEKRPVSPATPRGGLLGRARFQYDEFMKEPGDKFVLLMAARSCRTAWKSTCSKKAARSCRR